MIKRKHTERAEVSRENSGPAINDYTLREWAMMYERFAESGLKPVFFFFTFFIFSSFFRTGFGKMESWNKRGREQMGAPGNSEMLFSTSIAVSEEHLYRLPAEDGLYGLVAFSNYR